MDEDNHTLEIEFFLSLETLQWNQARVCVFLGFISAGDEEYTVKLKRFQPEKVYVHILTYRIKIVMICLVFKILHQIVLLLLLNSP